ncbi:MAG: PAS domain-containing protein [Desulfobacterales bacterium]
MGAGCKTFYRDARRKRRHYSIEKRYIRKGGQIVWGNLTVSGIRDRSGNLSHVIGMVEDISERIKTQELLREKERLLSDIINFLPDAMFVIDTHGKVLAWNRAMETMTGINAEDMLGRGDYEYASPPLRGTQTHSDRSGNAVLGGHEKYTVMIPKKRGQ